MPRRKNNVTKGCDPTPAEAAKSFEMSRSKVHGANQNIPNAENNTALVTFSNIWTRRKIYANRTRAGRGIFISADLSKEENRLFYLCRQAKKENRIKNTWTMNNKIFIMTHAEKKIEINDSSHLNIVTNAHTTSTDSSTTSFLGFTNQEAQNAMKKQEEAIQRLMATRTTSSESLSSSTSSK